MRLVTGCMESLQNSEDCNQPGFMCTSRNGINYRSPFDEQCIGTGNKYKYILRRHFGTIVKKYCKTCKNHHNRNRQERHRKPLCNDTNNALPNNVHKRNLGWKRKPPAAIG